MRGNPFMIKTLIEYGNPNPHVRDENGKFPIHIAAAKLDKDSFEQLIRTGADPLVPDADGNSFLHIMALGVIKDTEYDFIRNMVSKQKLRLTRNKEGRTCLNLFKSDPSQAVSLRGQPNYKRKLVAWFEQRQKDITSFIDSDKNLDIHQACIDDNISAFRSCIIKADQMTDKINKEIM
jgi:hypothetical protein